MSRAQLLQLRTSRWRYLGVAVLPGLYLAQSIAASPLYSVTFDEQYHLTPGYVYLTQHDLRFHHDQNPPLYEAILAAPLLARSDLQIPIDHPAYQLWGDVYLFSNAFFWHSGNDAAGMVHAGRVMAALTGLLLGPLLFVWGRQMFNEAAGWIALFLLPTIVAIGFALARWPWRREWRTASLLYLPALFLFVGASISKLQLGYRYLLPVLPFLFLMAVRVVAQDVIYRHRPWPKMATGAVAAWLVISSPLKTAWRWRAFEVRQPPEGFGINTYWRVTRKVQPPVTIFVHLLDHNGNIVAQVDRFGAATRMPEPGDVIVQRHPIHSETPLQPGKYQLAVGLYNPDTLERFTTQAGEDRLLLGTIEVTP